MAEIQADDTIAAIATAAGEGAIALIRLSGPEAVAIAGRVFTSAGKRPVKELTSHHVHLGEIRNPSGEMLDQVLLTLFRSPHSYTGEDMVEISTHGGLAVTRQVLEQLYKKGARAAEPGEFTKRAFLNGKMDLTQAEAVVDLIQAKSERSLEVAARQLQGTLSGRLKSLRDRIMAIYAHLEAFLDFPEEDLEVYSDREFMGRFEEALSRLSSLGASFKRGSILKEGVDAVLIGRPNVGKSSLFNALLERDHALVSEFPGTTRDRLQESIEIDGIHIRLTDTAGLAFSSQDPLDQIGMDRTRQTLEHAQLVIYMVEACSGLSEPDREVFAEAGSGRPVLVVANKTDLGIKVDPQQLREWTGAKEVLFLSSTTREGMDKLEARIAETVLEGHLDHEGEQITRLRHKNALENAHHSLLCAYNAFREQQPLEVVSLDLKAALDAIRELIGEIYSDDLLDIIFSEFCIGK